MRIRISGRMEEEEKETLGWIQTHPWTGIPRSDSAAAARGVQPSPIPGMNCLLQDLIAAMVSVMRSRTPGWNRRGQSICIGSTGMTPGIGTAVPTTGGLIIGGRPPRRPGPGEGEARIQ